jgi:hypothetical protein
MKTIEKFRVKTKMQFLAMVAGLFLSASLSAQEQNNRYGGLFGRGNITEYTERGLMNRDNVSGGLNNQAFGQDVPLGNGLLILFGVAVGYAIIKKKED